VAETLAGWCAWAVVAMYVNAHSHTVPASALPTWMPPT
jgi:cbb3-type cytochrome oxidase subunit 1